MRKYITTTLLCFAILHTIYAQGTLYSEVIHISTPYKYADINSLFGKNLYFESKWAKAKILKADNSVIANDSFLYNYDKIEHRLLVTNDFRNFYEIDRREFKAVLFFQQDSSLVFKHINFINDKDLFEVIVKDQGKYSLCKVTRTKMVKTVVGGVSYFPNGLNPTYEDFPEYFIFFPNKEYKSIYVLKKAPIERIFSLNPDIEKVQDYLNSTGRKIFEERDLIKLIMYLNNLPT